MNKLLFAILTLVFITGSAIAQKHELKYNLEPGKVIWNRVTNQQQIDMNMGGQQMVMHQRIIFDTKMAVEAVDEAGNISFAVSTDRAMLDFAMGDMRMSYNSDDQSTHASPLGAGIQPMIGNEFHIKVSPNGELLNADQLAVEMNKLARELEKATKDIGGDMGQMEVIDGTQLMEMVKQQVNRYPAKPIAVGESWKDTIRMEAAMPMMVANTYTLREATDTEYKAGVNSTITSAQGGKPQKVGDMTLSYNISGTVDGFMTIDKATGVPTNVEMTQNLNATVSIQGPQMNQQMPMKISGQITVQSVVQ